MGVINASRTRFLGMRVPFYGWAVVGVGSLVVFCSGPGQSYVFSVFVDPIIASTSISRTMISALYAVGTIVSALTVIVVSRLVDRYGARLMLTLIASALGMACFGMAAAAGPIAVMLGFAALRALGQGSMTITATLMTAQWFVRYRGRAMALIGIGFAASNAILPPVARFLIDNIDWREAYMILGVMVWVLIIPTTLLIVRNRPEDVGLYPDGAAEPPASEQSRDDTNLGKRPRRVLTTLPFWMLAIPLSAPSFVTTALIFHQVSIFGERGLSPAVAAGVFIPLAIASATASTGAGFLVDRLGPKMVVIATLTLLLASIIAVNFMRTPTEAVGYAVIIGASSGMMALSTSVAWAHYYGRHGLGAVQGPAMTVSLTASAIGPLPIAGLHQMTGDYSAGMLFMGLLVIACIVVAALFRPPTHV